MADDHKENENETHFINLYWKPISVRVQSDKSAITEQHTKEYSDVDKRIKEAGGGGIDIGVPDVGDLGVTGNGEKETESDIKKLQEAYTKLRNVLLKAGFVVIEPYKQLKFTTQKAIKYVSVYADGALIADNYNNDDPEFIVDVDDKHKAFLSSNKTCKIAKYYEDNDLFSHAYEAGMVYTLSQFKELYYFGKDAKIDDKDYVLSRETVKEIATSGADFSGLNLAVSEVLRVVGQRWFKESVTRLYEQGKDIETMDKQLVAAYLKDISDQAIEIAENWDVAYGWYSTMKIEIEMTKKDITKDDKAAQDLMNRTIDLLKQKIKDEKHNKKITQRNIGLCALGFLFGPEVGAITLGVGGGILGSKLDDINAQIADNKSKLNGLYDTKKTLQSTIQKIETLSKSLDEMMKFCSNMGLYFKKQGDQFETWGEAHSNAASGIKQEWKQWTAEQAAKWIANLEHGKYVKYQQKLIDAFKENEINGASLPDVNKLMLKMMANIPTEPDGADIESEINKLVQQGAMSYRYVKRKFDRDLDFIKEQSTKIQSVNDLISKMVIDNVFKGKDIKPKARTVMKFTSFGTPEIVIDPQEITKTMVLSQ